MYALRPAFKLPEKVDLPNTMYNLPSLAVNNNSVLSNIQDKKENEAHLDLEKRWDAVLEQLQQLKLQLGEIAKSVHTVSTPVPSNQTQTPLVNSTNFNYEPLKECVINADPTQAPYSLLLLRKLITNLNIELSCHTHSSIPTAQVAIVNTSFSAAANNQPSQNPSVQVFLIWKKGLVDVELVLSRIGGAVVVGEVNILRYLARLGAPLGYSEDNLNIDAVLDQCYLLSHVTALKERQKILKGLESRLGSGTYFGGSGVDVCDVAAWAAVRAAGPVLFNNLPSGLVPWYQRINQLV